MSTGERRLFDPDRYSPIRVSVFLRLPQGNVRSFIVASALGTILDGEGSTRPLKSAKDATGVLISAGRRRAILGVLAMSARQWRRLCGEWESRGVAHRCSPGSVTLFTTPLPPECPACHADLDLGAGHNRYPKADTIGSPSGQNRAAGWDRIGPFLSTGDPHLKSRSATKDRSRAATPSDLRSSPSEGSLEDRPHDRERRIHG